MKDDKFLYRYYSMISSFKILGERILFSFVQLYADQQGATSSDQGYLLSFRNLLSFGGQNVFGSLSDRFGRIIILLFGFLLSAFSSFMFLRSITPVFIIVVFAFYSVGFSAVQPAFNALIGDTFSDLQRAEMLGRVGATSGLLGGIGFLVVGLLSDTLADPYEFLFITAASSFLFATIAVIILYFITRDKIHKRVVKRKISLLEPLKVSSFRKFVFYDALFNFAMSTSWPLFPKRTNELATTSQVTIMWAITFICFSISARYTGRIKKFIGSYRLSFFFSRNLMWLVPLSFAFATSWVHLIPARMIAGLTFGYYQTLQKEIALDTVQQLGRIDQRGLFLGTHALALGIATFSGSIIFGNLVDYLISLDIGVGYDQLFMASAIIRFIFAFGFLRLIEIK